MIPEPNIEALKAMLSTAPVRSHSDARKPVRRVMDANAGVFRSLAEKGHTADKVVDAFLADFPDLRESRPDLDDDGYRKHVRDSYNTFRRVLGLKKSKTSAPKKIARPKVKAVEERAVAVEVAPAPVPAPQVEKPVLKRTPVVEPVPAVSPIGRNKIRSLDDI